MGVCVENVVVLTQDEAVLMDDMRVKHLTLNLGEAGAQQAVTRAMDDLAIRLSDAERHYAVGDLRSLAKCAASTAGSADDIGLVQLAHCALAVADCAKQRDDIALSATLARLIRLGDRSLSAVWDWPVFQA